MKTSLEKWHGGASIQQGIGVFVGSSGDNVEHCHWAHQISLACDDLVSVYSNSQLVQGRAIFIPANTLHSLKPGRSLSIYLDPCLDISKSLKSQLSSDSRIQVLSSDLEECIYDCFYGNVKTLEEGVEVMKSTFSGVLLEKEDPRLMKINSLLLQAMRREDLYRDGLSRDELAEMFNLSPSRFSHWFTEKTGMPLRSYKKWLRLTQGIELILRGSSIQAASLDAGFSDQAHFARTFKTAFGVSPAVALKNIDID